MDVYEGLHKQFPKLYYHTFNVEGERLAALIKKYQDIWDSGKTVRPSMMEMFAPPERDPIKEDEEFSIVVGWLAESILSLVIEDWERQFSKEQILQLLNALGSLDPNLAFEIDNGCKITINEIVKVWNKTHDEDSAIHKTLGVEI